MTNKTPFSIGDKVVCIVDEGVWRGKSGNSCPQPKRGGIFTIVNIEDGIFLALMEIPLNSYHYIGFAPINYAADMEFTESEVLEEALC